MAAILTFICVLGGSLLWMGLSINDSALIDIGGILIVTFLLLQGLIS
jgi:hypothetical protein